MLGASFGALLGMRIAASGHRVTFVCRDREVAMINDGRLMLRLPARNSDAFVEIHSRHCPIRPDALVPNDVDPRSVDLVCLAMQEPSYSAPGVRELVGRIAAARAPCLSIMNMPLPPFLEHLTSLGNAELESIYTEPLLWAGFDKDLVTMASALPRK